MKNKRFKDIADLEKIEQFLFFSRMIIKTGLAKDEKRADKILIIIAASIESGFTLIELLVVIAIISLLASVILASLKSAKERAYDVKIKNDITQVRNALELYAGANNYVYPPIAMGTQSIASNQNIGAKVYNLFTSLFAKPLYAQSRNTNCAAYDALESVLVPTYIGEMPKHPLEDGGSTCYKYFSDEYEGASVATVYGSLVTERFTNGTNKQTGVVLGRTDIDALKYICANNDTSTPFPLFSADGGGDICNASAVVDMVIGVTNGDGDLSSDTYIYGDGDQSSDTYINDDGDQSSDTYI